jgi:hypothetical protein
MKKALLVGLVSAGTLVVGLVAGAFLVSPAVQVSSVNAGLGAMAPNADSSMGSGMTDTQMGMSKSAVVGSAASTTAGTVDQSVIKTANLTVETPDVKAAIKGAKDAVASFSGTIDNWSQQANNAGQIWNVSATVRVPADQLDAAIAKLSKLGKVTGQDIGTSDVTTQVLDIDARVTTLKASVARLTQLVKQAKSTADLIAAENALSDRQAELQSLEQQQKYLKDQVAMSSIYLQIYTEGLGPVAAPTNFVDGIGQGWNTLLKFFVWLGVAAGWLVPWLLVVVPVAAIVWFVIRIIRRRKK